GLDRREDRQQRRQRRSDARHDEPHHAELLVVGGEHPARDPPSLPAGRGRRYRRLGAHDDALLSCAAARPRRLWTVNGVTRWHSRGMADAGRTRTVVPLPRDVQRPFEVYLNAVLQVEGSDYVVRDGTLVFERR